MTKEAIAAHELRTIHYWYVMTHEQRNQYLEWIKNNNAPDHWKTTTLQFWLECVNKPSNPIQS